MNSVIVLDYGRLCDLVNFVNDYFEQKRVDYCFRDQTEIVLFQDNKTAKVCLQIK